MGFSSMNCLPRSSKPLDKLAQGKPMFLLETLERQCPSGKKEQKPSLSYTLLQAVCILLCQFNALCPARGRERVWRKRAHSIRRCVNVLTNHEPERVQLLFPMVSLLFVSRTPSLQIVHKALLWREKAAQDGTTEGPASPFPFNVTASLPRMR